ncbi:YkgJ family cysteine cluster protein [Vibrio sp. SNU_ST1]|uniref:YkgJ family cysteine cluster protein n=1 Tax=Vibrio sp. SNU_ST1 TaxID=3064001 RepID=UPI00272993C3|nr:YkgJ family cysteine cluster protein [Vibrio sp. SNU_ST1]WKY58866.1 YkgJ family cysteine cluster protein [Vibrio sp. SNU_ST1]
MECRLHCGACCTAPSITSSFPLHPHGKKSGERCKQLTIDNLCKLFGKKERPQVCFDFKAESWVCGTTTSEAIQILTDLESSTA